MDELSPGERMIEARFASSLNGVCSSCRIHPANIYLFKVNNKDTRKRCKICSKLTIKTLERCQWCRSGVFFVNLFYTFLGNWLLGSVYTCSKSTKETWINIHGRSFIVFIINFDQIFALDVIIDRKIFFSASV